MLLGEDEEIDVLGKWWVPGRDQPHHPGELFVSKDEHPCLKLFDNLGFLTKPENGIYTDRSFNEFFPIICGRTELGPATLINFQQNKADFLIFDALFESVDEARFRRIRLQFQHFSEWLRQIIIDRIVTFWKNDKGEPIGNDLEYKYHSLPEESFVANELEFRILFGISTKGGFLTPVTLTPMAYLDIAANAPKSVIEWWFDIIRPMRDLFSLAMDRPIDISRFIVFDEREAAKNKECRVYFKGRRTKKNDKELIVEDMLFAKTDIDGGNLGLLVNNWFRIIKDIPMVCSLYSSVTSIREQYLEEEFLSLAQAAELYHRSHSKNAILPKKEWKDKIKYIMDSVPESEREWLREKLIWSNSPTLQNRLEELLEKLEPTTSLLVSNKVDFATIVKHTRNYFTHWDNKQQKKAATNSELYFVSTTLMYLIAASLLTELGFTSEKVAQLFARNHRINNFRLNSDNPISPKPKQTGESAFYSIHVATDSENEG
jgi:hypothetical protein